MLCAMAAELVLHTSDSNRDQQGAQLYVLMSCLVYKNCQCDVTESSIRQFRFAFVKKKTIDDVSHSGQFT